MSKIIAHEEFKKKSLELYPPAPKIVRELDTSESTEAILSILAHIDNAVSNSELPPEKKITVFLENLFTIFAGEAENLPAFELVAVYNESYVNKQIERGENYFSRNSFPITLDI